MVARLRTAEAVSGGGGALLLLGRLLLAHFGCAAPFLLATVLQKWILPWVGEQPTTRARWHRALGRFAVLCGALASLTALALAPGALVGT